MPLKTLDEYKVEAVASWKEKIATLEATGIACPNTNCDGELANMGQVTAVSKMSPPTMAVHCPKCGYSTIIPQML